MGVCEDHNSSSMYWCGEYDNGNSVMPGVLEGPGLINDHKPDVRTLQGPSPTSSSQGLSPTNHELPGSPGSCIRSNEPAYLELRPVKPKSEPGELDLSSPDSGAVVYCAGCHNKILDRWYLQAVDRAWHASCLRCAQCARPLEGALTCFARQGSIYCKEDYLRLYGMRRCGGCGAGIGASELVMRAKDMVYHISCFTCNSCGIQLSKGDHFGMRDHLIYCRVHYEALLDTSPTTSPTMSAFYPTGAPHPAPTMEQYYGALGAPAPILDGIPKLLPPINGTSPATGTSRGRPRKRRKESDASPTLSIGDSMPETYRIDGAFGPGSQGSQPRPKRVRTSFKHHQLRTMKSYFAINHNPDAKDLKQLSQKTGLSKRVLQVWFQNARAKWRRTVLRQQGGAGPERAEESGALADLGLGPVGLDSGASMDGGLISSGDDGTPQPTPITAHEQSPTLYADLP